MLDVSIARNYKKYVSKPSFVSQKIFSKNFVAIHETKLVLKLDKSIYVGFSILDVRKLMYEFRYKHINRRYGTELLLKDTDSLVYEIETFMKIFRKIKIYLILKIIHEIQSFSILPLRKFLVK